MNETRRSRQSARSRWALIVTLAVLCTVFIPPAVGSAAAVSSPSWSVSAGPAARSGELDFGDAKNAVITEYGIVFAFKEGQMLAFRASTGERLWKFGSGLLPYFYAAGDTIYAVTSKGQLFSVNVKGKLNWSAKTGIFEPGDRIVQLGNLYVLRGGKIQAFGRNSGQLLWETDEAEGTAAPTQLMLYGDVLIGTRPSQSAFALEELFAYEPATGKKLWSLPGHHLPVSTAQGELISHVVQFPFPLDDANRKLTCDVLDPHTGKVLRSYVFRRTLPSTAGFAGSFVPAPVYDGGSNTLYIFWGDKIEAYNLLDAAQPSRPIRTLPQPQQVYPTGSVACNQLLVTDMNNGRLSAVTAETGKQTVWDAKTNSPYRAVILGRGLYQLYEDGTITAYDLRSGKPIFTAATGRGNVHNLLQTGPYLIVVKQGKLSGYMIPENLR